MAFSEAQNLALLQRLRLSDFRLVEREFQVDGQRLRATVSTLLERSLADEREAGALVEQTTPRDVLPPEFFGPEPGVPGAPVVPIAAPPTAAFVGGARRAAGAFEVDTYLIRTRSAGVIRGDSILRDGVLTRISGAVATTASANRLGITFFVSDGPRGFAGAVDRALDHLVFEGALADTVVEGKIGGSELNTAVGDIAPYPFDFRVHELVRTGQRFAVSGDAGSSYNAFVVFEVDIGGLAAAEEIRSRVVESVIERTIERAIPVSPPPPATPATPVLPAVYIVGFGQRQEVIEFPGPRSHRLAALGARIITRLR